MVSEVGLAESIHVFEQAIVQGPELPLRCGTLGI